MCGCQGTETDRVEKEGVCTNTKHSTKEFPCGDGTVHYLSLWSLYNSVHGIKLYTTIQLCTYTQTSDYIQNKEKINKVHSLFKSISRMSDI